MASLTLSPAARDLIRSGLFGKDFDTYKSEIIDFLGARFGTETASNIVASEQGIMLIEMTAFALSTASWYGDRQADDTTLRDARLREAAVTIARQLGYKPSAAVAPTVTITMTITSPTTLSDQLIINKGAQLIGPGGSAWETVETTIFDIGVPTPKTFTARVGTSIEEVFTSTGLANQILEISTIPNDFSIAQSSVAITVDGISWTEQQFLTYDQTNHYEVGYGFNPPRIIFGDGIAGNIPAKDTEIRVKLFTTPGPSGAAASNTVTAFSDPLLAGTTLVTATLVHNDPSTPGSVPETIEKIKVSAPLVFQSAKRAVTLLDLDGLINSFVDPIYGAVAKGRATTPRTVNEDAEALTIIALVTSLGNQLVSLQASFAGAATSVTTRLRNYWDKVLSSNCSSNIVLAQILSADVLGRYVQAPVGLAQALESYLDEQVESTVKVRVTDGTINLFSINLTVQVKLLPNYTSQIAQTTVIDTVRDSLQKLLIGRDYGVSLRIGDLYDTVESIQGVDYTQITIQVLDNTNTNVTTTKANSFGVEIKDYEVLTLGTVPVVTII